MKEQFSGVLEWPILGNLILVLCVILYRLNDLFECAMLSNELESRVGANLGDWIKIVAAEQNAEIDELSQSAGARPEGDVTNLRTFHA